tara:strand:- start:92 stop:805 length:714 start_codon:yes stop_codon:yes gene_type:complete
MIKSSLNENYFDFRLDDVGASTKFYERYSKTILGNIGFLKNRLLLGSWGPYRELNIKEYDYLINSLKNNKKKLAVAITANWLDSKNQLLPFHLKFPEQANLLKKADKNGLITIVNHGLTHSVVGMHMPKLFKSNRIFHRDFADWLPEFMHRKIINQSQEILENWLEREITILAPPGNQYSLKTIKACENTNIKYIHSSLNLIPPNSKLTYLSLNKCRCFHDREIKLFGNKFIDSLFK